MPIEHLHEWLASATRERDMDIGHWDRVVELDQMAFRGGIIVTNCTWQTVVLLPKGNGEFREISLVEVLWKTVSGAINHRIVAEIIYHDIIHGFWEGRGTGTASLEANLIHQMMEKRGEVLYKVFMDPRKAYDALD